jgi:hypothetical protein
MEALHNILVRSSVLREILPKALKHVRPPPDPHWRAAFPLSSRRLQDELQPTFKLKKASIRAQITLVTHPVPLLQSPHCHATDPISLQPMPEPVPSLRGSTRRGRSQGLAESHGWQSW